MRYKVYGVLTTSLFCILLGACGHEAIPVAHPTDSARAKVARVIDGDTVELQDGRRVRYVGINTPERHQPFYDLAKEANQISIKDFRAFNLKEYYIKGLYLMGGTSIFDLFAGRELQYLVVIDDNALNPLKRELLHQKLDKVRCWLKDTHGLNVSFLVVNMAQIKQNGSSWISIQTPSGLPDAVRCTARDGGRPP